MIRKMELKDIEAIKEIDKDCFKANYKRITDGIRGYIDAHNNVSIVYEIDNKVVGFNFIHIWGNFGWFGPLGVHPEYQAKGIGKALIKETIKILEDDLDVKTIGLNTMPESKYNIGFYMNLGFKPFKLTLNLKKDIESDESIMPSTLNRYKIKEIDINNEENYLIVKENLKSMSSNLDKDFDLTNELYLIKNEAFGTIFVLELDDKIEGIVICYTKSIREEPDKDLQIKLAIISDNIEEKEAIDSIVSISMNYANTIKYKSISIDCNTYNFEICNYLMGTHNFKIDKSRIMMLMGEQNIFTSEKIILMTKLAG